MSNTIKQYILVILKVITGIAACYYVSLFLYISLSRISFPFTLDWIEGPVLIQINRVLLGQNLYIEPNATYVPLVYQPLYFYIAAVFTKLLGVSLFPARLVSILASSGSILLIFFITRKITNSYFAGIVSAGLFAASNGIVWTWFDFARVDTLSVFFSLVGLYFLIQDRTYTAVLAGLFFAFSFFTKQSAIIIIFPASALYFLINRKKALFFITTVGFLSVTGVLLLNYFSDGWYYFYAFTLPSYHRLDTNPAQINYVVTSLTEPILVFIGVLSVSVLSNFKKVIQDKHFFFFLGLALCTTIAAMISALSIGATRNTFIPAYALIAIACGKGLQILQGNIAILSSEKFRFVGSVLLILVCLYQFSLLQYKAKPFIPTAQDFSRAKALIKELQNADEEFLFPSQNYLALFTDKKVYYHEAAIGELLGRYGKTLPNGQEVIKEIQETVQSKQVSVVYLPESPHEWLGLHCEKEETYKSNRSVKFVPTIYKMRCY